MVYSRNQKKANMTPTQGSWQEPVGHAKDFVFILKAVGAAEGVCVCVCVCVLHPKYIHILLRFLPQPSPRPLTAYS